MVEPLFDPSNADFLKFLNRSSVRLAELATEDEVYECACQLVSALLEEAVVVAGSYDSSARQVTLRAEFGLPHPGREILNGLVGQSILSVIPSQLESGFPNPASGEILDGDSNLTSLTGFLLPVKALEDAQKQLNLGAFYLLRLGDIRFALGFVLVGLQSGQVIQHEQVIEILGSLVSMRLLRIRAEDALVLENDAVSEISRSLLSTLELQQVLTGIVNAAKRVIHRADRAVIHLIDEADGTLEIAASAGTAVPDGKTFRIRAGEGVAGKVLAEGRTINVGDTSSNDTYLPFGAEHPQGSLMVAPIQGTRSLLGTISVRSSLNNAFTRSDERLLSLLGLQAALAINNARLFADERRFRQLAEELLQQEKARRVQLVQSEKLAALGRIVASVAHELNNPLQAIQNALYLVQMEEGLNPQTREDLRVALSETNRMADLIARLRETYRPTAGEEFQPEPFNALVAEIERLLTTHMRHKEAVFSFDPDPHLPPVQVIRDQIRQVMLNLCLNAIEAMPEGGKLTLATRHLTDSGEVMVTIHDTGPGIPEDVLPYVFDPFFTTKEGGTGLGLAITYDIVQRHHGRIEVSSVLGKGTTFTLWLPLQQAVIQEHGDLHLNSPVKTGNLRRVRP